MSASLGPESPDDSGPSRSQTRVLAPDVVSAASGPGALEKLRRAVLTAAGIGVVAAGVALAPYLAVAAATVLVWILRSGSLAASSAGLRRATRGVRWYDGAQVLLAAPWHAVASLPGALLLVSWSLGLGLAAVLLCFAAGLSMLSSLGVIGAVVGTALWWGPGSRRLRGPVQRIAHPLSARPLVWFFTVLLTVAAATGLAAAAGSQGPLWLPASDHPFADVSWPRFLQP